MEGGVVGKPPHPQKSSSGSSFSSLLFFFFFLLFDKECSGFLGKGCRGFSRRVKAGRVLLGSEPSPNSDSS